MFFADLIKELIYKPFFAETFLLIKYYSLSKTARKLLQSDNLYASEKGVRLLQTLGLGYPQFRQEIIDAISKYYREDFNKYKDLDPSKVRLQRSFIKALASVKKEDENHFPYLFDIGRTGLYSANSTKPFNYDEDEIPNLEDYRRTNFKDFYMPGCFFMNINFNASSFENADIGGSVFYNCSLEFCNFKNAKICGSLFDESILGKEHQENALCFIKTRLNGANLHEAQFQWCKIRPHKGEAENPINILRAKMPQLEVSQEQEGYYSLTNHA